MLSIRTIGDVLEDGNITNVVCTPELNGDREILLVAEGASHEGASDVGAASLSVFLKGTSGRYKHISLKTLSFFLQTIPAGQSHTLPSQATPILSQFNRSHTLA